MTENSREIGCSREFLFPGIRNGNPGNNNQDKETISSVWKLCYSPFLAQDILKTIVRHVNEEMMGLIINSLS